MFNMQSSDDADCCPLGDLHDASLSSSTTINAMRSWLTAERSASGYSAVTEQVNLMVLVLLSPDFNIA